MSSNNPPNVPIGTMDSQAAGPQAMWMPYGFVQFDGTTTNNTIGGNRISHPQGMSAYNGVIFQQPIQSPQVPQIDNSHPNSAIIPRFPMIASPPPPPVNFPSVGNVMINSNAVLPPAIQPVPENILMSDHIPSMINSSSNELENARDSQFIPRNSMITSSQPPRQQSPTRTQGNEQQQFQPVFQPMLVGWQPVLQQGFPSNFLQSSQEIHQRVPDVIGYQADLSNVPPIHNSHYDFQQFPPDVVPGTQGQPSYVNNEQIHPHLQHFTSYAFVVMLA